MADKFLSRQDGKQRILGIDLARVKTKTAERAVLVSAEIDRLTLFWTADDGSWNQWFRHHDRLNAKPVAPDEAAHLGWSSRVAIAPTSGRLHLFYKRRFTQGTDNRLLFDVFNFDEGHQAFIPETPDTPLEVPLAQLGYGGGCGLSLWADVRGDELLVVAQLFPMPFISLPPQPVPPHVPPHLPAAGPQQPQLVLLRAAAGAELTDPAAWKVTVLDQGPYDAGYDFDARREGGRLGVVHRRRGAMYAIDFVWPIDPFFSGAISLQLSDAATTIGPRLRDMAIPLVLVDVDLNADTVTAIDDTLPPAEHPQLHALDPVIVTGDRLFSGRINLSNTGVDPQLFGGSKALIMGEAGVWRLGRLPGVPCLFAPLVLPLNLQDIAGAQTLVTFDSVIPGVKATLELASLLGLSPLALLDLERLDKDRRLTFLHAQFNFDAISATRFDVGASSATELIVTTSGFSLPDINHARISETVEAPENAQFQPFELRQLFPQDNGLNVRGPSSTANLLGGLITAHRNAPQSFYAYVDMGDGGGRVLYAPGLRLPPTEVPSDKKTLSQDMVPDPDESDRVFVKIESPDFLPLALPAYSTGLLPQRIAAGLNQTFDVPAIVSGVQPPLDTLAQAAAVLILLSGDLNEGSLTTDDHGNPVQLVVTKNTVADLQFHEIAPDGSHSPFFDSDRDQPFALRMRCGPYPLFAGNPITFEALAPNEPAGGLTFRWNFSNGATATGQRATTTFMPPAGVIPRLPLAVTITLTATKPDGTSAQLIHAETVPESFWAELGAPIDAINFQDTDGDRVPDAPSQFQVRKFSVTMSRYKLSFDTAPDMSPSQLRIDYLTQHKGDFRFRGGSGQGVVEERAEVSLSLAQVKVNGPLAALIAVKSATATLRLSRRFTPGVLTSDVHDTQGQIETVQDNAGLLPNALSCKPVGDTDVTVVSKPDVSVVLADLTRQLSWLVAALLALVPSAMLIGMLLPFLVLIFPIATVTMLLAAGIGAILSALIAAGFAFILTDWLGPPLLSWIASDQFYQYLDRDDTKAKIAQLGLLTNAGEGLAEAIARRAIQQARADGHAVADVTDTGLDRMRPQLFETIVVTEGIARVKMNVSRG